MLSAHRNRTTAFRPALFAAVALLALTSCDDTTAPDGSANNPLPLELRSEVSEDFLTPSPVYPEFWTSGQHLVARADFGSEPQRHLEFVALDHFLPTDPPELVVYVHWTGEPDPNVGRSTVQVDLAGVMRLHDRQFGVRTPWRIRFAFRRVGESPEWTSLFMNVPAPEPFYPDDLGVVDGTRFEAESMVGWFDGTASPDPTKVETVIRELETIRASIPGQPPALYGIRYFAPGYDSDLFVRFDPAAARAVRLGTYSAWARTGLVSYVNSLDGAGESFRIFLSETRARCGRIQAFASLPGVVSVAAFGSEGRTRVFPFDVGGARSYLFRGGTDGWPHRTYDHYWYFVPEGSGHRLVGEWDAAPGVEPPAWWPEVQRNIDLFETWRDECHSP